MITRAAVVVRSDDLVSAVVGEDTMMMDVHSGTFFVLDDIGSFVWERLAGPTRVADLLVDVQGRFDVAPEQCEADVLALLERMRASGLVGVGN